MDYAAEYQRLHANPKYFQGFSIIPHVDAIAALVAAHRPDRLLDFGSGKGHQYLAKRLHEAWGGLLPHCYDVGVRGLSEKPEGQFGGVICTDVLEHIEEADVPAILDDIVGYVRPAGFVFFAVACRPASDKRTLSDGRNPHVTVREPSWWDDQIVQAAGRRGFSGGAISIHVEYDEGGAG